MRRMLKGMAAAIAAFGLSACGGHDSFVRSDDSALGRVVVYRNGIAYYERLAEAEGGKVTLAVPMDKVDDFLKSLTVTEVGTGKTVPVSYPTQGSTLGNVVEMTIQLPPGTGKDLQISYITDSPAWKPSYRVVVGDDDKVQVQGWAIVDNTSGEDWNQVRVGVGASSALSFRYDLRSVMHVHRETLGGQQAFVQAPPLGGATHKPAEEGGVLLALNEQQLPAPAGHPLAMEEMASDELQAAVAVRMPTAAGMPARAIRENETAKAITDAPVEDQRIQGLANRLKTSKEVVKVEGYAPPGGTPDQGLEQANRVRNRLVELGVAPDRVQVGNAGVVAGKQGVELKMVSKGEEVGADGLPVGESHFDSGVPMTVAKGTSAMVAVLDQATEGEVVYVYNPDADRGDAHFAFKAVRFKNPTESTLETGPVTVYGSARFIGEGLTEAIPPKATALIPFALDRQVKVDRTQETRDELARLMQVKAGVLTAEVRHLRTTHLEATNRSHKPVTVFLRYDLPAGWTLGKAPAVYEEQGEARLFAVELPAGTSQKIEIEAYTPLTRTVDLRSTVGMDLVRSWVKDQQGNDTFAASLKQILSVYAEIGQHHAQIEALRLRMDELRTRAEELTVQVERLETTRTGDLLRTQLAAKLGDLEQRIQASTLQVVKHQEDLMLARIRFQDAVAELSLAGPTAVAER
jgi:hypothetical protein